MEVVEVLTRGPPLEVVSGPPLEVLVGPMMEEVARVDLELGVEVRRQAGAWRDWLLDANSGKVL